MSSLLDRTAGLPRPPSAEPTPSPLLATVVAAGRAVVAGLIPLLAPVVIAWVLGAGGRATWSQTVRFTASLWLLGHHVGLSVDGGHVGLVPLGLLGIPLAACWFAGRRLARQLDPRADRIAAGATRAAPKAPPRWVLVAFAVTYAAIAWLVSLLAAMPGLAPVTWQAPLGPFVISLAGVVLGAAAYRYSGARRGARTLSRRAPLAVRSWLRPALGATVTWLGSGAACVAVLVATQGQGVLALHRALDAGIVGGVILTAGELVLLPNLAVWAGAVMAGPGIAVGSGTSVTLVTSTLGPLPAVPVLAALPAPGRLPLVALALLAVPVLAGVVAGALIVRRPPEPALLRLRHVGGTALVCAGAATVLAWLSGGPAGPGRLGEVGPDPLLTGAAFGLEIALGAVLVVAAATAVPTLATRVRALRHPPAPKEP